MPIIGVAPAHNGFSRENIEHALPYQIDAETSFNAIVMVFNESLGDKRTV